jgi:hypothetical protein
MEAIDGFFTNTTYQGAFSGAENWADGWTAASALGHFGVVIEVPVTSSSFDGTNFTINFVAEPGANYKVTQSATLQGAFTDVVGATLLDAPEAASITFAAPAGTENFFRIERTED